MNEAMNVEGNEVSTAPRSQSMNMMISRQAQEVQAAMVIAKKCPRDEFASIERIKRSCQRLTLAEQSLYSYSRGGKLVSGPSIRLAEVLARQWGNIDCGVIELSQNGSNGSEHSNSEMMAYAWDLETNTRVTKIFTVEHKRDTKNGSYKLTDSRDIYEATANFGARRMRACILSVIPVDVVEEAVKVCRETMAKGDGRSFQERVAELLKVFKKEFKITKEQIEKAIGLNLAEFGNEEIIEMQGIYKALKDGAKTSDFFEPEPIQAEDVLKDKSEGK